MIKKISFILISLFLSINNMKSYIQLKKLSSEVEIVNIKKNNILRDIKNVNEQINNLSDNVHQDLLETKAMWFLGYSPLKSVILIH